MKKLCILHPWIPYLEEVLQKLLLDADYTPLYRLCEYSGCTKETLVPDMDARDCRQFLVTGK